MNFSIFLLLLMILGASAHFTKSSHVVEKRSASPEPSPGPNPPCPAECPGMMMIPCPPNPMGVVPEVNKLLADLNGPLQQLLGNLLGPLNPAIQSLLNVVDQLLIALTGCPSNRGDFPQSPPAQASLIAGLVAALAGGAGGKSNS